MKGRARSAQISDSHIGFSASADGRFRASGGVNTSGQYDRPGTYRYFCTLHPRMTGRIVVQ